MSAHQNSVDSAQPRLYSDLARWWPLFSAPAEYEEEAAFYAKLLCDGGARPPRRLLELGSGGGNNASTAYIHCTPGGIALFAPDHVRENFLPGTDAGGNDGQNESIRSWSWDPDPSDSTCTVDDACVMRMNDGSVHLEPGSYELFVCTKGL